MPVMERQVVRSYAWRVGAGLVGGLWHQCEEVVKRHVIVFAGFEDGGDFERRSLVRRGVQAAVEVSVLVGGVAVEGGWRHHRVSALPSGMIVAQLRDCVGASRI